MARSRRRGAPLARCSAKRAAAGRPGRRSYTSRMEELRERALGDGWRKLVIDGVAATPVSLKRGPAVKVVDGPRTETVPREEWAARLDSLLGSARNVHLLAPGGDV